VRNFVSILLAFFGAVSVMVEVGPHDAATNLCNYLTLWQDCHQSLPGWFSRWAWVLPIFLFCVAGLLIWPLLLSFIRHLLPMSEKQKCKFMSLEDATSAAYGAARNTDIGYAAETMNTNGVLAWFAYYYDTQGISIYGNVRNSTRVELLPSSKFIDIKVEKNRLIGKEHNGALIWENLQVKQSDHAKLLRKLQEHAKNLSDR
jgi:hypothetical protein